MSVTGLPGTEPTRVGIPVADLSAGLYLAIGVLVALHERERTGEGRWVQTSLLESMIAMMDLQAARWTMDGVVAGPGGQPPPDHGADGVLPLGRRLREHRRRVRAPAAPLLRRDRPARPAGRSRASTRRPSARPTGTSSTASSASGWRTRTTAEWVERLNAVGVPCGPVLTHRRGVRRSPRRPTSAWWPPSTSPTLGPIDDPAQRRDAGRRAAHRAHGHARGGRAHHVGAARARPRRRRDRRSPPARRRSRRVAAWPPRHRDRQAPRRRRRRHRRGHLQPAREAQRAVASRSCGRCPARSARCRTIPTCASW